MCIQEDHTLCRTVQWITKPQFFISSVNQGSMEDLFNDSHSRFRFKNISLFFTNLINEMSSKIFFINIGRLAGYGFLFILLSFDDIYFCLDSAEWNKHSPGKPNQDGANLQDIRVLHNL